MQTIATIVYSESKRCLIPFVRIKDHINLCMCVLFFEKKRQIHGTKIICDGNTTKTEDNKFTFKDTFILSESKSESDEAFWEIRCFVQRIVLSDSNN